MISRFIQPLFAAKVHPHMWVWKQELKVSISWNLWYNFLLFLHYENIQFRCHSPIFVLMLSEMKPYFLGFTGKLFTELWCFPVRVCNWQCRQVLDKQTDEPRCSLLLNNRHDQKRKLKCLINWTSISVLKLGWNNAVCKNAKSLFFVISNVKCGMV